MLNVVSRPTLRLTMIMALLLGPLVAVFSPVGTAGAALTDDSPSAQVTRLYQAYFLRPPEQAGHDFWVDELANGRSLAEIAQAFSAVPEFSNTYGPLDDLGFVTLVYNNVLERDPENGPNNFWVGELQSGNRTRGEVMIGFSESQEFRDLLFSLFDDGPVFRLYCAYFDREPDEGGQTYWANEFANDMPLATISQAFSAVPEFVATYGPLTNAEFVDLVYLNVLDRARTANETFWLDELDSGNRDRGSVMIGFSESTEYKDRFVDENCPVNTPPADEDPVAVDDDAVTGRNHSVDIVWGDNDSIVDNAVLDSFDTTSAQGGSVSESAGVFSFDPATDFVGSDTFTYTLCDDDTPTPTCDSATVTVEILAEPDCTIFINYPKDGVDLDLNELFLKSFDCYQAYEQEYGFAHTSDNLVWSNITIDGVAATHGDGTRGILSEDVVVDPAAYADGVVVVAGELALVHNSTTYMTATFTETFTDNGTTWVNSNSSETFDHILNPFAN